jgi:hypothetical protein
MMLDRVFVQKEEEVRQLLALASELEIQIQNKDKVKQESAVAEEVPVAPAPVNTFCAPSEEPIADHQETAYQEYEMPVHDHVYPKFSQPFPAESQQHLKTPGMSAKASSAKSSAKKKSATKKVTPSNTKPKIKSKSSASKRQSPLKQKLSYPAPAPRKCFCLKM